MSERTRIALAALGPALTILMVFAGEQKPLEDHIQLLSMSFGVTAVVLAIGYVVQRVRGQGVRSVVTTTAIGVGLVWLALFVTATFSPQVRSWLLVLVVTAPVLTFPSVFGAALATCAGPATASSRARTDEGADPSPPP